MIAWRTVEEMKEELTEMLDAYLPDGGDVKIREFGVSGKGYQLENNWRYEHLGVIFAELDTLIRNGAPSIVIALSNVNIHMDTWRRLDGDSKIYTLEVA